MQTTIDVMFFCSLGCVQNQMHIVPVMLDLCVLMVLSSPCMILNMEVTRLVHSGPLKSMIPASH
jgi:hypothetical protein